MTARRRGAGSMTCSTSRVVPSPTVRDATARRFRFAFRDSSRREVQASRREAIATHLDGWVGCEIVTEHRPPGTMQCWVTFTTARRVPVEVAAAFVRDCPHVVRGTFAAVVSQSPMR
jgi:hypothetical protein